MKQHLVLDDPAYGTLGREGPGRLLPQGNKFLPDILECAELLVDAGDLSVQQR